MATAFWHLCLLLRASSFQGIVFLVRDRYANLGLTFFCWPRVPFFFVPLLYLLCSIFFVALLFVDFFCAFFFIFSTFFHAEK